MEKKDSLETIKKKQISSTGRKHTEETKIKLSISLKEKKRKPFSEETKEKIKNSMIGKKLSEETKKKISKSKKGKAGRKLTQKEKDNLKKINTGKVVSEETKIKISKANKGKKHTKEALEKIKLCNKITNEKMKKKVISSNGMIFNSITESTQWVRENISSKATHANISMCCSGKLKTAYGLKWRYN